MPEPSETSDRLQAPTTKQEQQPQGSTIHPPSSAPSKLGKSSQPSDESGEGNEPTKSRRRRRPGTTVKAPSGTHAGSSRSKQRSTTSPTNMMSQASHINYTRTGRISKAKKGLKVHNCECGRSYTRAEHLRRHQKNHAQDDALVCDYADCGKVFYRLDLLHRHRERHNEPGNSGQFSPESSPEAPPSSLSVEASTISAANPLQSAPTYFPTESSSPMQGQQTTVARYTFNPFRTPQLPRTPRPSSGIIARTPPSSSHNPKQRMSYTSRPGMSVSVPLDSVSNSFGWGQESLGQSPAYSSSSGYTSPHIGPGDFGNFYPHVPYSHGPSRTRTPSNASLHEHWSFPQSPSSSISTMPYTWASNEKMPTAPLAYINSSYPMASLGISASIDATAGYVQFDHKTMMQRDEEEASFLFRDQPYGMGQLAYTYPSEQFLNKYWRLFHPTFPVVHRFSFENMNSSPLLRAAMIAIDGQYSNDTSTKRNSRVLHDRCIKLLEKREREPMADPERPCDYQAVFLVEVLSQYRARRAAKTLTPRFGTLYHKMAADFRYTTSQLGDITLSLTQPENATLSSWIRWVELGIWQRLLTSCYILESQQAMLLAREPIPSQFQESGMDLPFPIHTSVWDAMTLEEWTMAAQQYSSSPQYVFAATPDSVLVPCDSFQSSILVAAHYNRFDVAMPYSNTFSNSEIDLLLDESFVTKKKLLTAKLLQVTPIRELLAVSGESWILSEKVSSPQTFTAFKTTLRTWAAQLWSAPMNNCQPAASREALKLSVEILTMALNEPAESLELGMGTDMGVYFAGLVLWAITTAASTRANASQQALRYAPYRHNSLPPSYQTSHNPTSAPATSTPLSDVFTIPTPMDPCTTQAIVQGLIHSQPTSPARHDSLSGTALLSYDQITYNSLSFLPVILSLALQPQQPLDLSTLQAGCISMLLWVKLQLRGTPLEDQTDMAVWASAPGDGLGELLDGVVGSLERVLNRGWTGWGI